MIPKEDSDLKINKKRVAAIVFGFVLILVLLFNLACNLFFMNEHISRGLQLSLPSCGEIVLGTRIP